MWGDNSSTCGGIASVLWGDSFSTVGGYLQYCGGCSVQWGDNISTVGDSFSTVEVSELQEKVYVDVKRAHIIRFKTFSVA